MVPMEYAGAWAKMIHKKNMWSKILILFLFYFL